MTAKPPGPPGTGVSSLFANAKATAEKSPWANADLKSSVTLGCPACGAPQEVALDFLCRYCKAPMGTAPKAPEQANAKAGSDSGATGMTPSQQELVTRFRTFMQKVMTRLRDVLAEAETGCREMIKNNPADPIPLNNVLGALRTRKVNLDKKIYDAWSKNMVEGLADARSAHAQIQGAVEYKGNLLDQMDAEMKQALAWMEDTFEHFRVRWSAEAVRAMWPLAEQAMKKPVNCTQCGAPLQPRVRHQSDSVTCPGCRAVNQVIPEQVVGMYFTSAPHALAEEAAFQKRAAVTQFRRQVEAWRAAENARTGSWPEEGVQSLQQWEALERDYWSTYVTMKARLEPMTPEDQKKFVESRMKPFVEDLERNPVWRRAKGLPT
jgi:hypothetical protein